MLNPHRILQQAMLQVRDDNEITVGDQTDICFSIVNASRRIADLKIRTGGMVRRMDPGAIMNHAGNETSTRQANRPPDGCF